MYAESKDAYEEVSLRGVLRDKSRVMGAIKAMVLVAAFAGVSGNALATQTGPVPDSAQQSNQHLVAAVNVVTAVIKKGSPDLRISVSYTNDAEEEEYGHALSDIRKKGCRVTLNNKFADTEQMQTLQRYTGWDDEQMAIMLVAHELQHCVTSDDIRRAAFGKDALSERTAQALHTYVWGDAVAQKVARNPNSPDAIKDLVLTAKNESFGRANESISDISALFLVQKLSTKGLTVEAVEGLKQWRTQYAPDKNYDKHYTVPALDSYAKMLSVNALLGTTIAPEEMAQAAYTIVGKSELQNEYTKSTVDDLKKARESYVAENQGQSTPSM